MKSIEFLGNFSASADKGCDPKVVLLGWILHQSMHKSFLSFVCKRSKNYEKYCFRENGSGKL